MRCLLPATQGLRTNVMISILRDLSMQHSFHNIGRNLHDAAMPVYHCALCRLPIMKTGWSDTKNKYKELITERVVGQMFLPGVVGVDRFKTKFEGVGSLVELACLCMHLKNHHLCVLSMRCNIP